MEHQGQNRSGWHGETQPVQSIGVGVQCLGCFGQTRSDQKPPGRQALTSVSGKHQHARVLLSASTFVGFAKFCHLLEMRPSILDEPNEVK